MKPITNPVPIRIKVRGIVALLLGICLTSCATSSRPPQAATKPSQTATPAASANWVKVRSNPPTWYPRGTRTDCPTDFRSGEWVGTGDRQGTRYFIPVHVTGAIPRQALVKEALAARSAGKQFRSSADNCVICIQEAGNIVVGVPLTILAWYGAAAASPDQSVGDFDLIRPFDP